jgi:hypothetical protein
METPGVEREPPGVGSDGYAILHVGCNHTHEGESNVRSHMPAGIPANDSQVVERITARESCAAPTLDAGCRVQSSKIPYVMGGTGWVERKQQRTSAYLGLVDYDDRERVPKKD